MCGICGVLNLDGSPADGAVLARMTRRLAHRGPDDEGLHVEGALGLGHRRLSILDLSAAGHQPMLLPERGLAISYNGEVFNYPELRDRLSRLGHRFRSGTDTEMILRAYAQWGVSTLERFNGMFAFALWDGRERTLLLARDRLGVKPLYYHHHGDLLAFASEAKALLEHPRVPRAPDPQGIGEIVRLRYVLEPDSAFAGIRKVPPGHFLRVRDGALELVRWWDVEFAPDPELTGARAAVRLGELLDSSVRLRRLADVPVGAFLSGGLDSSLVASVLADAGETKTFTVGFGGTKVDETGRARLVADALGTVHFQLDAAPPDLAGLRSVAWHLEEPIADPAVLPTYAVSRLAATQVKVVLTGEGSDEVNGGYERYRRLLRAHRAARLLPARLVGLAHRLPAGVGGPLTGRLGAVGEVAVGRLGRYGLPYLREERGALDERIAAKIGALLPDPAASTDEFLNQVFRLELKSWLPADLLLKVDRMSMAHSLEARTPYLDYRVVELCARIPPAAKLGGGTTKRLLRRVAAGRLPASTVARPQHGFLLPLAEWLGGRLAGEIRDVLEDPAGREILPPVPPSPTPRERFTALLLRLWYRSFFVDWTPQRL